MQIDGGRFCQIWLFQPGRSRSIDG